MAPMMMTMTAVAVDEQICSVTVCAWCPAKQARTEALRAEGKAVSHGMCEDCAKKMDAMIDARREDEDAAEVPYTHDAESYEYILHLYGR